MKIHRESLAVKNCNIIKIKNKKNKKKPNKYSLTSNTATLELSGVEAK